MKDFIFNTGILIRRCIYITLYLLDRYIFRRQTKLFVLCYHSIEKTWRYSVTSANFKKQMGHLSKEYVFISIDDLLAFFLKEKTIDKPSVLVTFDDGYRNVLTVKKFLKDKDIHPTMFLLSDTRHANRAEVQTLQEFLTDSEVRSLAKEDFDFGSHSATHADFSSLSEEAMKKEVYESKMTLEKSLQIPIFSFAYPKGRYTKQVLEAVKNAGYKLGFTMDDATLSAKTDPLRIPRVGVDNTHSVQEFKTLYSPSVILFRRIMKGVLREWL